jgi:hypothetical protein
MDSFVPAAAERLLGEGVPKEPNPSVRAYALPPHFSGEAMPADGTKEYVCITNQEMLYILRQSDYNTFTRLLIAG